jgi:DNA helicase-2/ATP-dependent DNA helicase PcrA
VTEFNGNATRIFGPPGTGKTTKLAELVRSLITTYGPDCLSVASFSTTAAKEIAGRFADDGVRPPDHAVRTLHSHAFRAIGHGAVALDAKTIVSWNEDHPEWSITPDTRRGGGDTGSGGNPRNAVTGDELISSLDKLRATLTPPDEWPENVRQFARRWEQWKTHVGAVDYTDMVEDALEAARDGEPAPGNPRFFIADEAQDQTPLESALVTAWGEKTDHLFFGLDDDQAINAWRGGDPAPILGLTAGPNGQVQDEILGQSYRVPEAVRRVAQRWILRLGSHRREKEYRPRVDAGGNIVMGAAFKVPETLNSSGLIDRIESDLDADPNETVMVIASCNYMLEPLLNGLRQRGVPFHNPYRPGEARWNPLGGVTAGVSTAERVFRYLIMHESLEGKGGRLWTGEDIQYWSELVKLGPAGMRNGAKKLIKLLDPHTEVPPSEVERLFQDEEAFDWATSSDPDWLAQSLLAAKQKAAMYPIEVARAHGPAAIQQKPRLTIGTIHSTKGGQSGKVYVAPDISGAGARAAAESAAGRDELIRLFYVAMTRSYRELRLLQAANPQYVERGDLLPPDLEVPPE